jgi:hypothetical protein
MVCIYLKSGLMDRLNPREITVTSNLTLKASFIKKTYPLAVTVEGEGTVAEEVIITRINY